MSYLEEVFKEAVVLLKLIADLEEDEPIGHDLLAKVKLFLDN